MYNIYICCMHNLYVQGLGLTKGWSKKKRKIVGYSILALVLYFFFEVIPSGLRIQADYLIRDEKTGKMYYVDRKTYEKHLS